MRLPVATCGICDEPILIELSSWEGVELDLEEEFAAAAEEHLRSHPEPVQARFWLRRFLDEMRPGVRELAVKRIYTDLRALWGDQDAHAAFTIDEALGSAGMYRLWLAANRCSYWACRHAEALANAKGIDRKITVWTSPTRSK